MLLDIRELKTYYHSRGQEVRAVDGVSLTLEGGENLGLVGESGCGKTTFSKSLLRINAPNARIVGGSIRFKGRDLAKLSDPEMRKVRWREISMVAQSAMNSLDPVYTVGDQILETLQLHTGSTTRSALRRAAELFELVGLEPKRLRSYPHQLSGGMRQRAVIALALALDPELIIADEPTTALDVVVQDGILKQLELIQGELKNSMVLVTHDVSLVAEMCHRVAVMYAGRMAEVGPTGTIFNEAAHPYTIGLLNAFPTLESAKGELISIPGAPPDLAQPIPGCAFAARCPFATDKCRREVPELRPISAQHYAACHYAERAAEFRRAAGEQLQWQKQAQTETRLERTTHRPDPASLFERDDSPISGNGDRNILAVSDLLRWFTQKRGFVESVRQRTRPVVKALDGVSFEVGRAEILGLAGESGSGKSTLGEVITGLQNATGGLVSYGGQPLFAKGKFRFDLRREIQMAFQDPYETLNPRFTIFQTLLEPLRNFGIGTPDTRFDLAAEVLRQVELHPAEQFLDRYPHELSGGQRQRVAIARAIVSNPALLVADEPVSMLDVSIRAGVLNLFRRFRDELGMSIVYISHDLATIRYICDRTAILYLGRLAEIGPTAEVIENPRHPYTRLLTAAVPSPNPDLERKHVDARGEIPDPLSIPNGCRFHRRCPFALAHCGFEGRDLKLLIENAENGRAEALRAAVTRLEVEGTSLIMRLADGTEPSEAAQTVKELMREHDQPIDEAVEEITVDERYIEIRFPRLPEPEHYEVGARHTVACFLYEPERGPEASALPVGGYSSR